jgi:DNA-binding NtrC family response regulator
MESEKDAGTSLPRKTNFEIVRKSEMAPVLKPDQEGSRILSVAHELSLLKTRELLFSRAGFKVSSFQAIAPAIRACKRRPFDLIVVGHSIPLEERKKMVKELRAMCQTPILALVRPNEPQLMEADYVFDSTASPLLLLETVIKILASTEKQN